MANPHVSNVYGGPQLYEGEPDSFESISYTSPTPVTTTVFRAAMQAPVFEWFEPQYDWWKGPPLPLTEQRVILRSPMQAPSWAQIAEWEQAWNPVNLALLHGSLSPPLHFRVIGSSFVGDARVLGSKIVRRYQ